MKLLLDTCTFIWLAAEPERLGARAAAAIDDPANALFLSDASVWEICLKWRSKKLALPQPPRTWVANQTAAWRIESVSIEQGHLYRTTELELLHADPFDRLLVAQAIEAGLHIVSPDLFIQQYPVSTLWS